MLTGFSEIGQAIEGGNFHYQYAFKAATPVPGTAGFFVDLNQASGLPKYNAFSGTAQAFNQLSGSGNSGVYTGPTVTGKKKYLVSMMLSNPNTAANTVAPDHVFLLDYLGFYPLIDCDDTEAQILDNTQTLPRFETGEGVRAVMIVQAPMAVTASVTVSYTNSSGVSGRSVTFNVIPGASIGVCATGDGTSGASNAATPFIPLASGDTGMRSIESITFASGAGGFMCIALVKPIANQMIYETGIPVEKVYPVTGSRALEIHDDAHLNFIIQRSGTLAGSLRGELVFAQI